MNYNDLVELDDEAEMIDLGVASLETEGGMGNISEGAGTESVYSSPTAH